jgi:two-component SAPR family response regulator
VQCTLKPRPAKASTVKAAILDVNLAGEKIYPVANLLNTRRIPFIFITGYAGDSIDPKFNDVVVLQKPIERQKLGTILSGA